MISITKERRTRNECAVNHQTTESTEYIKRALHEIATKLKTEIYISKN